jgi:hypothetical protein
MILMTTDVLHCAEITLLESRRLKWLNSGWIDRSDEVLAELQELTVPASQRLDSPLC